MSYLSRKSIMSVNKFPVNNKSAAKSCTKSDNNKVFHPFCSAIYHLPYSCCIGIVCYNYRKIRMPFKNISKRNNPFPWKICSMFNCPLIYISHRSANSVTNYLNSISYLLACYINLFIQCCNKYFNFIIMR